MTKTIPLDPTEFVTSWVESDSLDQVIENLGLDPEDTTVRNRVSGFGSKLRALGLDLDTKRKGRSSVIDIAELQALLATLRNGV